MVVVDVGYHGHTKSLIDLSPYNTMGLVEKEHQTGHGLLPCLICIVECIESHPDPGSAYGKKVIEHAESGKIKRWVDWVHLRINSELWRTDWSSRELSTDRLCRNS